MIMKRFLLSLLLIICFNTLCVGACPEQIKTFYTTYLKNILQDNSQNEALCKTYLTEELLEKVKRLVNATGADPIIRAQDASLDAIETLNIKFLSKNWYLVSYYWDKKDSKTLTEIPIKTRDIDGKCKITFITPVWNGTQYGDELLSCGDKEPIRINQVSAQAFLESFYKAYLAEYCTMPENLSSKLASLRVKYLSDSALTQYKNAEVENLMDGHSNYDLLIDNYDYDGGWCKSLKFERLDACDYLVSYRGNDNDYKIVVSIIKDGNIYVINGVKVLDFNRISLGIIQHSIVLPSVLTQEYSLKAS